MPRPHYKILDVRIRQKPTQHTQRFEPADFAPAVFALAGVNASRATPSRKRMHWHAEQNVSLPWLMSRLTASMGRLIWQTPQVYS